MEGRKEGNKSMVGGQVGRRDNSIGGRKMKGEG